MATRNQTYKQFQRVEVEWNDHYGTHHGWTPNDHLDKANAFRCRTIGYVMSSDKEHLFVAQTLNDQSEHINLMGILKSGITKITKL